MAHLLANWLTVLRNCNGIIPSLVQSLSHFHQLPRASFPASLPLPPSPQSHLCFLSLFSSMALYFKSVFLLSQIFFPFLLMLSVSQCFFHCIYYLSSPGDTAKVDGTLAMFAELPHRETVAQYDPNLI